MIWLGQAQKRAVFLADGIESTDHYYFVSSWFHAPKPNPAQPFLNYGATLLRIMEFPQDSKFNSTRLSYSDIFIVTEKN